MRVSTPLAEDECHKMILKLALELEELKSEVKGEN